MFRFNVEKRPLSAIYRLSIFAEDRVYTLLLYHNFCDDFPRQGVPVVGIGG